MLLYVASKLINNPNINRLNKLINNPNINRLNSWHYRLLRQREKLMPFNQCYLEKYAAKEWLINGDMNSRFFYQSVSAKQRKTMIFNLKDESRVWITEASLIRRFVEEFTH